MKIDGFANLALITAEAFDRNAARELAENNHDAFEALARQALAECIPPGQPENN